MTTAEYLLLAPTDTTEGVVRNRGCTRETVVSQVILHVGLPGVLFASYA